MKEMDAKMDAFAAMKGTLARGPGAAAQGLPGLRRDRQAPVPRLPLSAAAARRRHARPGRSPARFQRVGARRSPSSTPRPPGSRPSCSTIPRGDGRPAGSRRRRRSRPTASPSSTTTGSKAHVLDDKGERLLSLAGQFNSRAEVDLSRSSRTSDIKFPTITLSDGKEVVLSPGNYSALLETNPNQADRGQGGGGAPRHLRRHRQHLRRDLQRRAAARLVHGPGAQLPDHARRRARRQRDPARRWSRR